jgi:hypothetical protein
MLAPDQRALLSAALRHQEDAERLLASSPDQSWHLAGYVTECTRKAILTVEPFRIALAHEQGKHFDTLFDIVVSLDPRASRLHVAGWAPPGTRLAEWKPDHRYDATSTHAAAAAELVHETGAHFDQALAALWLTHAFDPESL